MIHRDLAPALVRAASHAPSVTLTGPRQSGKTTLCRALFPEHPYITLEAPDERAFAIEDPRTFLARFPEGAVLDEVQRAPDLLSYLQGTIDDDPRHGRWILSGSQNFALLETISQSLAGRTAVHQLLPLTRGEIMRFAQPPRSLEEHLFTGGYPGIFDRHADPPEWFRSYTATYLERDVRTIVNVGNLTRFQHFLGLCAARTAQLLNYKSLADDCGISQPTAKAWLSVLEASFIVFLLPPYHANLGKRLVKMPKIYFHDTGLACWLLGIREADQLQLHPLRGPLFETWVVSETLKHRTNLGKVGGLYFYRDSNGAEADLVIDEPSGFRLGEAKSSGTPSRSLMPGVRRVRRQFEVSGNVPEAFVVYGGDQFQERSDGRLIPWSMLRAASLPTTDHIATVHANGRPLENADVLALYPNKTWKRAATDNHGVARFDLHSAHLPMAVFAVAPGFRAHVVRSWVPAERGLFIDMAPLRGGGAVIFPDGTGTVPGLAGDLNPIKDALDRTYLYTRNIAINNGLQQPVHFSLEEELHLTDANDASKTVRVIEIVGGAALVEYQPSSA